MKLFFKIFRITCEDTSPLISQMMDRNLPLCDRIRLRIHLAICEMCRYYKIQLETLRKLAEKLGQDKEVPSGAKLSAEAKENMRRSLQSEQ